MANAYAGEIDIELYGITYPMKIDMSSIAEFQSETGKDFMHVAMCSMSSFYSTREYESSLDRAKELTGAVSMEDAARLFHICAKKKNSQVKFGEFQEACLFEGVLENGDGVKSYPLKFVKLVEFAVLGIPDQLKKKK